MTGEEIIKLSEKTREEKYCDKYNNGSVLPSEKCEQCPLYDNEVSTCCCNVYDVAFLDGSKAGFKKGEDSMSDYVMELQHAAYDD